MSVEELFERLVTEYGGRVERHGNALIGYLSRCRLLLREGADYVLVVRGDGLPIKVRYSVLPVVLSEVLYRCAETAEDLFRALEVADFS